MGGINMKGLMRVLIVQNNDALGTVWQRHLERMNACVELIKTGSEALIALVKWALAQDHIYRLSAMCDAENRGSARVLEKAGFENEGLMRKSDICPNLSSVPRYHLLFSKVK